MTREEAKQALIKGEIVTHEYYTDNEWLKYENDQLITEDGYPKGSFLDEFWTNYQIWEDGWSIYTKILI